MDYEEYSISKKSQLITVILLLFIGSLGAHKFYVGKYISGVIYLLAGIASSMVSYFSLGIGVVAQTN